MDKDDRPDGIDLDSIRSELLARRRALFHAIDDVEDDLESLETPDDGERNELAQEEAFERLLDRLARHEQALLVEIQRALAKIATGSYGRCERCGRPIEAARLEALPEARYCAGCARAVEAEKRRSRPPAPDGTESRDPPLPPDFVAMTDEEIADAVREELAAHDGLGSVRVEVRKGRATLRGEVASRALTTIATEIVTDRLGLVAIDRLRIAREVGELPETATAPPSLPEDAELRRALGDGDTTTDTVEAEDEGTTYVPPDEPLPEPRKE